MSENDLGKVRRDFPRRQDALVKIVDLVRAAIPVVLTLDVEVPAAHGALKTHQNILAI